MTKNEFIAKLEKKLHLISEKERTDILTEYSAYIDDKMADGTSEEEAVAGFGDVDELAKEILEAYKINTSSLESRTDRTLDKAFEHAENLAKSVGHLGLNQIAHLIFDCIVLLILLLIGRYIIVNVIFGLFVNLCLSFVSFDLEWLHKILMSFFSFLYFICALYFLIVIMKRRFKRYQNQENQPGVMQDVSDLCQGQKEEGLYHERVESTHSWGPTVLKILLVMIAFPVLAGTIGTLIGFLVYLYFCLSFQTISWGLTLIGVGILLGCISLLAAILYFWPKRGE